MLIALGLGTAWGPITASGQPEKLWHVGFLTPRSEPTPPDRDAFSEAFTGGMRALGYVEGRNLAIAWRYANGNYDQLTRFAAELVATNPPVIVGYGTAAARSLKKATTTIPIVVAAAVDL